METTIQPVLRHGSLFSGIGGFDLAAEWMGWENVFHCEWNEFGQKILKHYWPNAESYSDITKTDFTKHRGTIDILTGGFPCQPFSSSGKRKGTEDDRHLWPEMLRAIREIKPKYIVGENVYGLVNWSEGLVFEEVQSDLEAEGYEVQPVVLPAASVGAPHRRDRVWFVSRLVSNPGSSGLVRDQKPTEGRICESDGFSFNESNSLHGTGTSSNAISGERKIRSYHDGMGRDWEQNKKNTWNEFPTQYPVCSGNDGISERLDGISFSDWRHESIKAYGNAIVPQVAYQIFKALVEAEQRLTHPKL